MKRGLARRGLHRLLEEPPPVAYLTRQPWYPWLIVGLVSIGAFIGQLDATRSACFADAGQDVSRIAGKRQLGLAGLPRRICLLPADLRAAV